MEELLLDKPGEKIILLGNEAIVRGALEAGVNFVSTYPGTPASEIGNTFFKIAKKAGVYFEFSTNEKVALEAGIGASFSGLKTLVAMKNFGLNVCLDALLPFAYTGTKGPTVIIVADDPSCHSSAQSEENSRGFAYFSYIPFLEPSDPQECKDFTKLAFQISEKFKIPVIIRTTTRVAHQKAPVKLGEIFRYRNEVSGAGFIKDIKRFVTLPPRVLEMKEELLAKIEKIKEFSEQSKINKIENKKLSARIATPARQPDGSHGGGQSVAGGGIITSGISYLYVMEALQELNLSLPVLKLGFFYPLPEKKIKNFLKPLKKVLIVEELEPFLEKETERLAKDVNCNLKVVGKDLPALATPKALQAGLIPEVGELKPEIVTAAVAKFSNKKYKFQAPVLKLQVPKRLPVLCPGCPYWLVISAIKKTVDVNKVIFGGEIGCYMLFGNPPVNLQDYLFCMGSSVGIAHGIMKASSFASTSAKAASFADLRFAEGFGKARVASATKAESADKKATEDKRKLITFIGDSSFFHAGIPALINTVFNKSNPLIIILANQTTAMTGHQPHPGAPATPDGIKIEPIVRACGVKYVKTIDQINQEEFSNTIKEFLDKDEVSVIIATNPCKFVAKKKNV